MCITSCRADSAYKDGATRPFFAPRLPHSRLLSPLDISSLLWYNGGGYICGRRRLRQTTMKMSNSVDRWRKLWYNNGGGVYPRARADYYGRVCLCGRRAGGEYPDYYTYEAGAGSRSISSRKQEQDMMRQQEPDYCQNLTHPQITIRAHAAVRHPPRLPGGGTRPADYYPDYHPRLPCTRMQQDERRVAARLRHVSHKQQEDNVYAAGRCSSYTSYKKTLQKLQNLTIFVKF